MGAAVFTSPGGLPPLVVSGSQQLRALRHDLEVASAQVKSCILLAGLFADGETWVSEPVPSRDHTERLLAAAGVPMLRADGAVGVRGPVAGIALPDLEVPGDFSSAAFHLVAGALLGDPEVRLTGVNLNPLRTGLLAVMRRMGVEIEVIAGPDVAGEPAGDIVVRRTDRLRGDRGGTRGGARDDRRTPAGRAAGRPGARHDTRAGGRGAAGQGKRPHRRRGPGTAGHGRDARRNCRTASR